MAPGGNPEVCFSAAEPKLQHSTLRWRLIIRLSISISINTRINRYLDFELPVGQVAVDGVPLLDSHPLDG